MDKLISFINICKRMNKESFISEFINDYDSKESLLLAKQAYKKVYKTEI